MKRESMLGLFLLLAACDTATPEGQVVAVVNGEEITRTEFNTALKQVDANAKADKAVIQNAVLDRLINQRLVVQAAKSENLDKSQDYILQSRSANDTILGNLFARKIAGAMTTPYEHDINAFIAANPSRFSQRTILGLDQIRIPRSAFNDEWMAGAKTLDAVAQRLAAHDVKFQRGRVALDSATMSPATYKEVTELPPGEVFAVAQDDMILISAVVDRKLAPLDGDAAHDMAQLMLRQQVGQNALASRMAALRKSAKIAYQTGFGPPKAKP